MTELGADGVQIASRFVATEECDASACFYYDWTCAVCKIPQSGTYPVAEFLHQFMYGCHLLNTVYILPAKYKTIFHIASDCIDQCFCNAIWH